MKTLIVYDSVFGNTAKVAQAMAVAVPAAAMPVSQVHWISCAGWRY